MSYINLFEEFVQNKGNSAGNILQSMDEQDLMEEDESLIVTEVKSKC